MTLPNYDRKFYSGHKIIAAKRKLIKKEYIDWKYTCFLRKAWRENLLWLPGSCRFSAPSHRLSQVLKWVTYRRFIGFSLFWKCIVDLRIFDCRLCISGNIQAKQNFTLVVFGIIILSPANVDCFIKAKLSSKTANFNPKFIQSWNVLAYSAIHWNISYSKKFFRKISTKVEVIAPTKTMRHWEHLWPETNCKGPNNLVGLNVTISVQAGHYSYAR